MARKSDLTLRGRIVVAFGMLGFVLSLVFALGVHVSYETVEHDLLIDMLGRELEAAAEHGPVHTTASVIRIEHFNSGDASWQRMPEAYRQLAPGFHEIGFNRGERHLLVKDVAGVRHVLAFQDENIERREEMLLLILVAGVLVATYLSIWLGFAVSRRVISPVSRLAQDVRTLYDDASTGKWLQDYADDEVGELAAAFHDTHRRLRELLDREQAFTGTISHELRTPLTVIGSNVDVLLAASRAGPERERLLRIRRAVQESADFVGTFLFMARSEDRIAGECHPRGIIDNLARHAAEQFGVSPAVEIADDAPETLLVPDAVFTTIARNLLHNAIEHGRAPVRIVLGRDRLMIEDAGGNDRAERKDGRLGLDIVQRICERQGWRLQLVSGAPGTRASVLFPGD